MNTKQFQEDIHTLLKTNDAEVQVYREALVPGKPDRKKGFITWDLDINNYQQCSHYYTGVFEGDLDIVCWSQDLYTKHDLSTSVMDVLIPIVDGTRRPISPIALSQLTYLINLDLTDITEVWSDKEAHPFPETAGTLLSFYIKASE